MKKQKELRVYPALHEEAKEGWVWLPKLEGFCGRFVKIKNMENCKSIVCVRREIDDNFIIFYEHRSEYLKKRQKITKEYLRPDKSKSIVISEHYRRKLDISTMQTVKFEIEDILGWRSLVCFLKATCDHPNEFVKISIMLGILSLELSIMQFSPILSIVSAVLTLLVSFTFCM